MAYNDVTYSVRLVKVHGEIKWGLFENDNCVYTCDDRNDAIFYLDIYKKLMR